MVRDDNVKSVATATTTLATPESDRSHMTKLTSVLIAFISGYKCLDDICR